MKRFSFFLGALALTTLFACGGGVNTDAFVGEWTLTSHTDDGSATELTECDTQTKWNFTADKAEPLADGTEVMTLSAKAPDDCKWYGFDAKWTVKNGQLFISTTKIGGMGGNSNAGMFTIVEQTPNKLVLEILGDQYVLEK